MKETEWDDIRDKILTDLINHESNMRDCGYSEEDILEELEILRSEWGII